MRILSLLLLSLLLQQAQPGVPGLPASVDGVVLDSETKQPLAGATVLLQDRGDTGGKMFIVTGNDGRFAFRSVPPGLYTIEASRSGYVTEIEGDSLGGPTFSLNPFGPNNMPMVQVPNVEQLTPGQTLSGLRLVLTPGGVITGRLMDEQGEAVAGAVVQALKTTHKDGLRERTLVQSVVSNDLGEYRFFMLKPGQYFISVVPPTLFIQNVSMQPFSIPLFYPGTIDAKAATAVDLHVGETIESVNFLSIPTKNRRITGGVQGNGSEGVTVILSPANGTASKKVTILGDDPKASFQFSDIVPGAYMLVASNVYGRTAIPLDVRNADLLGTRIILGSNSKIPARARIEGHPPGNDPTLEKLLFNIRPDVPVPGLETETYSPFANGRFTLDVLRGDYWIELTRTQDFYVKSITLEGFDVLNQGLHVMGSVEGPMEIVVDSHFGAVQGNAAAPNVTVVLVPDAARRNQRPLYKSAKSGNGVFVFEKVPPGDYKLFAWSEDTIDNGGPWLDPEYLHKYEDRATPVHIQGEMKTILDRPIVVF
jgi:Carboxypeptidase regulatory-like domain